MDPDWGVFYDITFKCSNRGMTFDLTGASLLPRLIPRKMLHGEEPGYEANWCFHITISVYMLSCCKATVYEILQRASEEI